MRNRMNRAEYENFRDTTLKQRFYLVYRRDVLHHLQDEGYRYLYKAINTVNNRPFWIFDKTDALLDEVARYKDLRKSMKKGDEECVC